MQKERSQQSQMAIRDHNIQYEYFNTNADEAEDVMEGNTSLQEYNKKIENAIGKEAAVSDGNAS